MKKGNAGDAPKAPPTYLQVSAVRGHSCPLLLSLPLSGTSLLRRGRRRAAAAAHRVGGGERRRWGSRSHAPRTRPSHAHSPGQTSRARSPTPALLLFTHTVARMFLHIHLRIDSQEHTLSPAHSHAYRSHTLSLTHSASLIRPFIYSHSCIHTVKLTAPTQALKHLHASLTPVHTHTHTRTCYSSYSHSSHTCRHIHSLRTHPVSHGHVRTHSHAHAHFTRAGAHRYMLNSPSGTHARACAPVVGRTHRRAWMAGLWGRCWSRCSRAVGSVRSLRVASFPNEK